MFGIDEGPSSQEKGQYNLLDSTSRFATGLGQNDSTLSSTFFQNLLTNPTKALTPEISAGQNQVKQQAKTNAEFGNRGGGTNASTQKASADNRTNFLNASVGVQTGAADKLAATGGNLLSTGQQGSEAAFGEAQTMQAQRAQMWNDIIKSSVAVASAPFTGGASLGGLSGGTPAATPGGGAAPEWKVPSWMSNWFGGSGGDQAPYGPNSD